MKRILFLGCLLVGCSNGPLPSGCTIDGAFADSCYAAVKGGGAIFGVDVLHGVEGLYFQATTIARGSATFPSPNNDVSYATPDGVTHTCTGSATWGDDGEHFCVHVEAACDTPTATPHDACVPSSMLTN